MQVFILQTSVLERLTPDLCAALTGEPEGEREKCLKRSLKAIFSWNR
jgi:ATP/maltotriose-dependent transcriptional regulator MalT